MAKVTFTVDNEGRPVHSDATVEVRPRLFLEGNFFIDLHTGQPERAGARRSGTTLPATQSTVAVQLDQVLTTLQAPERKNLQDLLIGFGTALTHEPTAAEDTDQDPDVQGETAGEALNDTFDYGGEAGRTSAIVNEALLGTEPHDLSKLIDSNRRIFGALLSRESQLKDLLTNFNVFTGALADESANLSETVRLLAPTLEIGQPSLANLNASFPQLRAFAIDARARRPRAPRHDRRGRAVARPGRSAARPARAGRAGEAAAQVDPGPGAGDQPDHRLPQAARADEQVRLGDPDPDRQRRDRQRRRRLPVHDRRRELQGVLLRRRASRRARARTSTATAPTCASRPAAGRSLASAPQPGGGFENGAVYGNTIEPPIGTRPAQGPKPAVQAQGRLPHQRATRHQRGRAGRPPEPRRAMRRAIREHLRDFVAIIALFVIGIVATVVILINQGVQFPSWAPGVGSESFELKGEFTSAQAVTPGQGQTVNINGVKVGEITEVDLVDGRAIVTMSIRNEYGGLIKADATMLPRPRTGLQDMVIEVDPGTSEEQFDEGGTVPLSQT